MEVGNMAAGPSGMTLLERVNAFSFLLFIPFIQSTYLYSDAYGYSFKGSKLYIYVFHSWIELLTYVI